jgi:hypothetical protein
MRSVLALAPALALGALGACSYTSYTPPARMMPLETATAPTAAQTDVQGELSTTGAFWGFGTDNTALRVRQGVNENLSVSAEGGTIAVEGDTSTDTNHMAYVGRVGMHVHQEDRTAGPHIAFTAGAGGGASSVAGRWISEDAGVILSGNGAWLVPFASIEGFLSQPIDARPFGYRDTSGDPHSDILTKTVGYRVIVGLELRDGHGADSEYAFTIGMMMGGIAKVDHDDQFAGLGAALRVL